MKRIITGALVLTLTIGSVQAQETSTEKGKDYQKEHRIGGFDQLNLTADQKAQLQTLKERFKRQSEELRNNTSLSAEQKKVRRRELHQQLRTQAEAILTPAQKEQWTKMKAERQAEGKQGRWNKDGRGAQGTFERKGEERSFDRGAAVGKQLNLTQEQQAKVEQIRTDYRSRLEAVRNDNTLTREQKRVKMQELLKAQQEQMKTVLTKEQLEKMESFRKERSARITK